MGERGPAKGSPSAKRCGPFGLVARGDTGAVPPPKKSARELPTEPPTWLPESAQGVYREYLPRVLGRVLESDLEAFAAWCHVTAELRAKYRAKRTARLEQQIRRLQEDQQRLAKPLGLDPAARARLPEPKDTDPADGDAATQAAFLGR